MPNPSLLLVGPIIVSAIVLLIRRWNIAASIIGAIAVWIFAASILLLAPNQTTISEIGSGSLWTLLGYTFVYQDFISIALAFIYIIIGFVFLLTLVVPQDDSFVGISLLILPPLTASLIMEPFSVGAIFFIIVGSVSAVLIQGRRPGSTLGSFRHLTLIILAVPLLLIAGWLLDSGQAQYLSSAAYLLLVAILSLLLAFPFQFWLGPNVSESRSLVPVILFGLVQLVVALFCLHMLVDNPIVYGNAQFLGILKASGVATIVIATLLILTCNSLGRLFGYLVLLDVGVTIIALSIGGRLGLRETIGILMLRTITLVFCGVGLGLIQAQKPDSSFESTNNSNLAGLAHRTPLGVALFVFGCLSLAGAPLTPGFAGRWSLVVITVSSPEWQSFVVILSVAIAIIGILRMLPRMFSTDVEDGVVVEPKQTRIVAAALLVFGALIAISPGIIIDLAEQLTNQLF
jgi:formate hydrogenlyase subunit 3/multisubunit Na+/H+ antiporter MnhD subunit